MLNADWCRSFLYYDGRIFFKGFNHIFRWFFSNFQKSVIHYRFNVYKQDLHRSRIVFFTLLIVDQHIWLKCYWCFLNNNKLSFRDRLSLIHIFLLVVFIKRMLNVEWCRSFLYYHRRIFFKGFNNIFRWFFSSLQKSAIYNRFNVY